MTAFGFVLLLLLGATPVVAEAHVPGGVLGVLGGVVLLVGGIIVIGAFGARATLAVPAGVGLGAGAFGWALVTARKGSAARRVRIAPGAEGLCFLDAPALRRSSVKRADSSQPTGATSRMLVTLSSETECW